MLTLTYVQRTGWVSDRRCTIADLSIVLFHRLGPRRLLQHLVLHDDLFVGVDGGFCVIRVIARLVSARLIGRLRAQRFFAFTAQQLTKYIV